ncbi:unnamed protein product [Acanthoscelides obtectus]|uniref:F-box domain-containing protein n=1 Tax=Acanthoscelides obtectus TaxID=200917 RepID=A0A9P0K048_ACAOB|nr:unnamed protein product [Acanthoscelides obtectus]CAK1660386.1 hypothetical protein AOBTE_LOCUS22034 [Acanthoscelides obtectus]
MEVGCLPDDIWEQILMSLPTYDVFRFFLEYPQYSYLAIGPRLPKTVDYTRSFDCKHMNISHMITTMLNYDILTTLKIDGIYWAVAEDLRVLVSSLKNLRELHALDTKLSLTDGVLYGNLRKLSLTVHMEHWGVILALFSINMPKLKYLYVKIPKSYGIPKVKWTPNVYKLPTRVSSMYQQLEELWILDEANEFPGWISINTLGPLKKVVVKTSTEIYLECADRLLKSGFAIFKKYFDNPNVTYFVARKETIPESLRSNDFVPRGISSNVWEMLKSFGRTPWGIEETRQMHLSGSVETVKFYDLNFSPDDKVCKTKHEPEYTYTEAAHELLLLNNSSELKRLNFQSCMFATDNIKRPVMYGCEPAVTNMLRQSGGHPFCIITEKLTRLTELEISHCNFCQGKGSVSGYSSIAALEALEKLSLEIPKGLDGSFLEDVFKKCPQLRSLSLRLIDVNDPFELNLSKNVRHATQLRDLRIICRQICLRRLFDALDAIPLPLKKIQRVFINFNQFKHAVQTDVEAYTKFLRHNRQLVFFMVVSYMMTFEYYTYLQNNVAKPFMDAHKANFYLIRKNTKIPPSQIQLPFAHHDFFLEGRGRLPTNVSIVHFEDF